MQQQWEPFLEFWYIFATIGLGKRPIHTKNEISWGRVILVTFAKLCDKLPPIFF
jgi:hypothetical protein